MSDQSSQRNPSPVEYAMTHPCEEVLQSLWDGRLTAATAAPKLAAITIPDPNIDLEEIEGHLWILWGKVLTCLEKVPGRLKTVADLISDISSLQPVLTKSGEQLALDEGTQHAWRDLPVLGWHLGERFNFSVPDIKDPSKRQAAIGGFVAMNALVATLIVYHEEQFDYKLLALGTLISALEYTGNILPDYEKPTWEARVLAAITIVEIAGEKIQHWDIEYESGPLIGEVGAGGPLWDGIHGFCKERWGLWQRRFFQLGVGTSETLLSDETREKARKAGEAMLKLSAGPDE